MAFKGIHRKTQSYVALFLRLNNSEEIYLECDLFNNFYPNQTNSIKGKPINGELKSKLEKKENFFYADISFISGPFFWVSRFIF
jgi:hypothetical protein